MKLLNLFQSGKKYTLLLILLSMCSCLIAQERTYSMLVHLKDGTIKTYNSNSVDSIEFVLANTAQFGKKEIIFVPIFGQSLALGWASIPVQSNDNRYGVGLMFNDGVRYSNNQSSFIPINETDKSLTGVKSNLGETAASGCVEQFVYLMNKEDNVKLGDDYYLTHDLLFVACGAGGVDIDELRKSYTKQLVN